MLLIKCFSIFVPTENGGIESYMLFQRTFYFIQQLEMLRL